jgi:hypothetical protein
MNSAPSRRLEALHKEQKGGRQRAGNKRKVENEEENGTSRDIVDIVILLDILGRKRTMSRFLIPGSC